MAKLSAKDILAKAKSEKKSYHDNKKRVNLPAADFASYEHGSTKETLKRLPAIEIDPSLCTPWAFHNRDISWLNEEMCSDLISSIKSNGQIEPILVRKINSDKSEFKYEIIYGVRRWFSTSRIPGKKVLARVTNEDDRTCMILMHVENADSKDISEFERAVSFKHQFESGLFKNQSDMANAFNISQSMVSKSIKAASILDFEPICSLLTKVTEIPVREAYKLSVLLANEESRRELVSKARHLLSLDARDKNRGTKQALTYLLSNKSAEPHHQVKSILKLGDKDLIKTKFDKSGRMSITLDPELKKLDYGEAKSSITMILDEFLGV